MKSPCFKEIVTLELQPLELNSQISRARSSPPRTWVSGLVDRVARAGGEAFTSAARAAYKMEAISARASFR